MAGKIHRRKKQTDFVTVDTHALRNTSLSWKAKGLITYIMQLPEDWQVNIADLSNRSEDGRDATASGLRELVKSGYIVREEVRKEDGTFDGYDYQCFERPAYAEDYLSVNGKTVYGKSGDGEPVNGKTVTNKYEGSKGLRSTKVDVVEDAHAENENLEAKKEAERLARFDVLLENHPAFRCTPATAAGPAVDLAAECLRMLEDPLLKEEFVRRARLPLDKFTAYVEAFLTHASAMKETYWKIRDVRNHFLNWSETRRNAQNQQPANNTRRGYAAPDTYYTPPPKSEAQPAYVP